MVLLIDAHCHLDMITDIPGAMARAKTAGVKVIISNGIDYETNLKTLELAQRYPLVKAALGLYPPDALDQEKEELGLPKETKSFDEVFQENKKLILTHQKEIIAIGEIGMDGYHGKDLDAQEIILIKMLELAEHIKKPVLIHSRKAEDRVLAAIEKSGINPKRVVLHCFSGKKKLVIEGGKKGYSFTVPTCVVRAENFQIMCKEIPLSQLLTETDAPWLSPYKEQKNEPAFVIESVKKIAEIKGITIEDACNNVYMNYQRIFL